MMPCTRMPSTRHTIVRSAVFALLLAAPASIVSAVESGPVAAFISKTCIDCHGPDSQEAGLRLDTLPLDPAKAAASADALRILIRVHDRVRDGEMPPKDMEQPSAADRQRFVAALEPVITAAESQAAAGTGRTTLRRMSRIEYEHTLRDLLALPTLAVKDLLPEDGRKYGFDKVSGALDISYVQMAKYLETATAALSQAVVRGGLPPERKVWRGKAIDQWSMHGAVNIHNGVPLNGRELAPGLTTHIVGDPVDNPGNSYRAASFKGTADSVAVLTGVIGAHQPEGIQIDRFKPPVAGLYKVRFSIWGLRWERTKAGPARLSTINQYQAFDAPFSKDDKGKWQGSPREKTDPVRTTQEYTEFYGEGDFTHIVRASLRGRPIGYFDAPSLEPTTHEFTVWLTPDDKISFHAMTLPSGAALNSGVNNGVADYEGPGIAYDWFEVEGPLDPAWPPESQRRLFGDTPMSAFPRPPLPGRPTIGTNDDAVAIPHTDFSGAGHKLENQWFLNVAGDIDTVVNFASPGTYELRVTAFQTPAGDEPAQLWTLFNGNEIPHGRSKIEAQQEKPQTFRVNFIVESAGPAKVGIRFPNDFLDEATKADRNLAVTKIEIAPVKVDRDTKTDVPEPEDLLRGFASRAFRRPVEAGELGPCLDIVRAELAAGRPFDEAMLAGYRAILCAPDFLLIGMESGPPQETAGKPNRLGPHALASRLAYFLWDSPPDDELLSLAAAGELAKPEVLGAQVERMLADPKSDRFVEHFLDDWLQLRDIDFTTPDPKLYPDYDPWLRDSMLAETRGFFRRLLDKDLGVGQFIDSDTILVNQRLAQLYGIKGVYGADLREHKVPAGVSRGGLITQASILKVTSNGTATSPVLRGVWVMERLLGVPRLPPPPNIPAVEPDATGATTIRQMIEMHRADNACAACHDKMDPYGLAMESFDPIGGQRDRYRLNGVPKKTRKGKEIVEEPSVEVVSMAGSPWRFRQKVRLGPDVDPSGTLADGRSFRDVEELKKLLLTDEDAIARSLAQQLLVYATGSGIRFSDRDDVDAIVKKTKPSQHGLRSLIKEIVLSDLFHSK